MLVPSKPFVSASYVNFILIYQHHTEIHEMKFVKNAIYIHTKSMSKTTNAQNLIQSQKRTEISLPCTKNIVIIKIGKMKSLIEEFPGF